jgi:hypothetical protein
MAKFGAIVWRERFLAFAIHFVVTLALAACAAALIFIVWFPDPFQTMVGGTKLFELVVLCDLVLGPLISLVIYDSTKARWQLVMDYSIIGAIQLAAMIYGVYIVAGTRPVYVAFNQDRIEVVTARDIDARELAAARDPAYADLPLDGPRFVAVQVPPEDRQDALFQSLTGNEEHQRPKFFVPYETALAAIRKRAKPIAELKVKFPASAPLLDAAISRLTIPAERVRWLPVRHRQGFWTALIDNDDGRPVAYVPFDPYGP